ncbi:hypothetical protein CF645_37270 [Burkholderia pseudomallei]|nr:hypothetical protein CF645_37270 [Burkholderia pseudomallei]
MRRFSLNQQHERPLDLMAPFSCKLDHDARFAHGECRDAHGVPMLAGAPASIGTPCASRHSPCANRAS